MTVYAADLDGDGPNGDTSDTPKFSAKEIQLATRVLRHYLHEDPRAQQEASHDPDVRELLVTVTRTAREQSARDRRKQSLNKIKQRDKKILEDTGIKKLREFRTNLPRSWNGGSIPLALPEPGENMMIKFKVDTAAEKAQLLLCENEQEQEDGAKDNQQDMADLDANGQPVNSDSKPSEAKDSRTLRFARRCHICHASFSNVHHFYDQLCPECAEFNFEKRTQEVRLDGKVAIVTGARVKIGYCIALKLLRSGVFVLVTTRFPRDAIRRYRMEPDYNEWAHRLRVYGLDFRDIPMVHHFCDHIKRTYTQLDFIVNNAAQTVRRPPVFYQHLLREETKPVEEDVKGVLVDYASYRPRDAFILDQKVAAKGLPAAGAADGCDSLAVEMQTSLMLSSPQGEEQPAVAAAVTSVPLDQLCTSVLMSQVPMMQTDKERSPELFPPGLYDIDDQQVDLRTSNSWTQKFGEVSTVELIECHAINTFAPWVLGSELRPLLADKTRGAEWMKDGRYIVHVSAMEGQFNRHKTEFHPHTNMAKSALNMLTRTSAQDLVDDGIFLNSVDTGWITDENPFTVNKMHTDPPLDEWDAAMRVLDPIIMGVQDPKQRHFGVFFKNYKPTRW